MLITSLSLEKACFAYEGSHFLFEDIQCNFPLGQNYWLHAPSGHGRSSLLQLLAGLQIPNSGKYLINSISVADMTFEEFLPYRLKIGYSFDFGGLLNNRTLLENLVLPLVYHRLLTPQEAEARALKYMQKLSVDRHKDARPAVVPGGVRKAICLLRALILHPEILLLDDPTVGLNEKTNQAYLQLIDELRADGNLNTIFLCSFDQKTVDHFRPMVVDVGQSEFKLNSNVSILELNKMAKSG